MAAPRLEAVVEEIQENPLKWVVIQPHLLFAGELLERLQRIVDTQGQAGARQPWFITEHLGGSPLVAEAATERFHQARALSEKLSSPNDGVRVKDL